MLTVSIRATWATESNQDSGTEQQTAEESITPSVTDVVITGKPVMENKDGKKLPFSDRKPLLDRMLKQDKESIRNKINESIMRSEKRATSDALISSRREEFKKKVKGFIDEKKKSIVENLDSRINDMNKNRTAHFSEIIEKLTSILDKIEVKAKEMQAKGVDISRLSSAISDARSAINEASVAIETQAGKNYVINISTETNVKNDVSTTIQLLKTDMQVVMDAVKKAKDSVKIAVDLMMGLRRDANIPSVTHSPSPNPTTIPTEGITPQVSPTISEQ